MGAQADTCNCNPHPLLDVSKIVCCRFAFGGERSSLSLREVLAMHVLFSWETPATISPTISDQALKAADNFVEVCIQHAAFLAGRGIIADEISSLQERGNESTHEYL